MTKKFKTKDLMLIALITAIYILIYVLSQMLITPLGAIGHVISPGLAGLIGGVVLYFMAKKVNQFGQFTILSLLFMGFWTLMGGGYLPWLITCVGTALIADYITTKTGPLTTAKLAIASGILHVGQAWGAIVPSWFFLETYRATWIGRGQTPEDMDAMIHYSAGLWGVISSIIVFVLAVIGIYIGHSILKKHFRG